MNKLTTNNKKNGNFLKAEEWNAAINAINTNIDNIQTLLDRESLHTVVQPVSGYATVEDVNGLNARLRIIETQLENPVTIPTGNGETLIIVSDSSVLNWAKNNILVLDTEGNTVSVSPNQLKFGTGLISTTSGGVTTVALNNTPVEGVSVSDVARLAAAVSNLLTRVEDIASQISNQGQSQGSGSLQSGDTLPEGGNDQQGGSDTPTGGDDNPPSGGGNDNTLTGGDEPSQGGDDTPTGGGETPTGGDEPGSSTGGDTPSTGGDTPSGGDEPSTGGDTGGSGSEQGLTSNDPQIDTVNGYWIRKGSGGLPDLVIDSLSYSFADVDQYDIRFVYPTGNWSNDLISVYGLYQGFNGAINDYSTYNPFNGDTMSFNKYTGRLYLMESIPNPSPKDGKIEVKVTVGTKTTKTLTITVSKSTFGWSWSSNSGTIDVVNNIASENLPTLSGTNLGRAKVKYSLQNVTPTGCISLQNTSWQDVVSEVVPQPQINVNESGTATVRAEFGPTTVYNSVSPETYSLTVTKQLSQYGHWEVKEGDGAWQTATELEYYGADASNYQVKFVPATGIENLTADYFGWDPSLAENERNNANRQNIGSDSSSVTGLINHVTVNVSTGVVTLPDSTINNGSSNAETMETITIGANVKVNDVTQGDPILFDIKVKRKKVSFRFSSSTGNVFDSTAAGSRVIEMPDIQIQKGADAEWINIEDDDSDYFKGEIYISRPATDTDVIHLDNEAINNINTAYKVTIPYNDAKDPDFWSNLIEIIDSGQCVLSMNWGPYDQYTFASTQHVTVTSEYRGNAPTPPSNDPPY